MNTNVIGKPLCRVMMAVAIMLLSLQAMAYDFSYTHQGKTLYYRTLTGSTNEVAVTSYDLSGLFINNNHVSGDVIIPSSVEYNGTTYNVTAIDGETFLCCSNLTSISIPSSVTYIGNAAFVFCDSLNSINVASGNTHYSSIDGVLYNYTRDTLIQCPGAKTSVTIPNGVTTIAESAFAGCRSLTSVTIGNGVNSIEWCAFQGCRSLTSITIPNSVTSISQFAFNGCSSLTSINVASGNTHYSSTDGALYNYAQDTLILCPEAKSSINIPNGVTCIKGYAFCNCIGLTSIPIPSSVTYINVNAAFEGCDALTSINVASGNTRYSSIDGVLYNQAQDSLLKCPRGKNSVSMPNSLTCIYRGAFSECKNLTSITIPNSVRIIDQQAFKMCSNLTSVTIGNSVHSID